MEQNTNKVRIISITWNTRVILNQNHFDYLVRQTIFSFNSSCNLLKQTGEMTLHTHHLCRVSHKIGFKEARLPSLCINATLDFPPGFSIWPTCNCWASVTPGTQPALYIYIQTVVCHSSNSYQWLSFNTTYQNVLLILFQHFAIETKTKITLGKY